MDEYTHVGAIFTAVQHKFLLLQNLSVLAVQQFELSYFLSITFGC